MEPRFHFFCYSDSLSGSWSLVSVGSRATYCYRAMLDLREALGTCNLASTSRSFLHYPLISKTALAPHRRTMLFTEWQIFLLCIGSQMSHWVLDRWAEYGYWIANKLSVPVMLRNLFFPRHWIPLVLCYVTFCWCHQCWQWQNTRTARI